MFRYLLLMLLCLLAVGAWAQEPKVYKWVDEQGVVHYTEQPPEGRKCREMELQQPFTPEQIEEAQKIHDQLVESHSSMRELREKEELSEIKKPRNAGRPRIPLPQNEISQYMETESTGISWDLKELCGRFSVVFSLHENLPKRVILEVHFPNPAAAGKEKVVKVSAHRGESDIRLESPPFKGFECRNYPVVVHIYDAKDPDQKIGTHYQYVQSSVDMARVRTPEQMAGAFFYGNCGDR